MKNIFFIFRSAVFVACVLLLLGTTPSRATTELDLRTGLKALLQVVGEKSVNSSLIAVLYNPNDPNSQADAKAMVDSITKGEVVPLGMKVTAQALTVANYMWANNVKAAFLAQGVPQDSLADVRKISARSGAVTISTDLTCVKMNLCVLGVDTQSSIQIYYSPVAAEASRISFTSEFNMLANQV